MIKKISHLRKPDELSLEQWQIVLRKQIACAQKMRIKNVGENAVFSTFTVTNPVSQKTYRVVICGEELGINYCSCPDFSINTLGTCKHIENVLRKVRKMKGGRQLLKQGFQPDYSAVTLRYGLKRRAAFLLGKNDSRKLVNLILEFFDDDLFIKEKGIRHFAEFQRRAAKLDGQIQYHDDAIEYIAQIRDRIARKEKIEKEFSKGVNSPQWGTLLKTELYPYQKEGVLFAVLAERSLIADEMGLGKTIQAIAASEIMARYFGIEKVLVICPTTLKYQWKNEINHFSHCKAQVIHGMLLDRHRQYDDCANAFFKITNYDVIHRDIGAIMKWGPDLIILDEAQRIKNWKTRRAQSVKHLKSTFAIVLTGTPIENRLEELHSIVEFIDRYHLGPLFRFLHNHQIVSIEGKITGYKDLNKIGKTLETIMIRRKSEQVLKQLPERIDKNFFIPLTRQQEEIHEEYRVMVARLVTKWQRYHFLSEEDRQRLMMALQKMRMVCDDTYLLDPSTNYGYKIDELELQLREILENPNVKVVIFSQWLRMMELIINMLNANKWEYAFLHGGVPSAKRGCLIENFHNDLTCRIFLSTEAGSVGLNLQNATFVVNVDLPWNPAVLEQRISRVYRLGQEYPVHVINLIAERSIEHGILGLIGFKKSMFYGVLDKGENEVFMGTTRFNRFIKTVEQASKAMDEQKKNIEKEDEDEALRDKELANQVVNDNENDILQQQVSPKSSSTPADFSVAQEHLDSSKVSNDPRGGSVSEAETVLKSIFQLGASFLEILSKSFGEEKISEAKNQARMTGHPKKPLDINLSKDKETGRQILQVLLPEDKTMKLLTKTIGRMYEAFKKHVE
ncbi:MAG: DEAD/DEAH box helicase [Candidatus Omnitrophota bacterium]